MADKGENILVEFDYNNITIIDPNKVIDSNGNVKDRYIKQENLVMYANLECSVTPRTKLAIGGAQNDRIRTVRLASINFLNPGKNTFLNNSYTDELTGKNTLQGNGVNQFQKNAVRNPNKSDDYYLTQQVKSNGEFGSVDNGMLGITSISIKTNSSFMSQISVQMEDIKGRTLFESGDESPYAVFFNLPYPIFYLTIKGFIGKALRLALMLTKFNCRYDTGSGNFKITLDFLTYKYTILSEVSMGALMAVPHMYKNTLSLPKTTGSPNGSELVTSTIEKGMVKIKELYSEYKSKGLIPDSFPELTLVELKDRIEVFIKSVLDSFEKQNLDPLTNLDEYKKALELYRGDVYYYSPSSWFNKYMDKNNFFVLNKNNEKYKIYSFKKEYKGKEEPLITELKGLIEKNNKILSENKTLGTNGSYTIDGDTKKSSIPIDISFDDFYEEIDISDIDKTETLRQRKTFVNPNANTNGADALSATLGLDKAFNNVKLTFKDGTIVQTVPYFIFDGPGSFLDKTNNMLKDLAKFKEQIESDLTKSLERILRSPTSGLGFVPTIRNVLAIIFANGEAFLRLLDDVHTAANNLQTDETRRNVILNPLTVNISTNTPLGPITDKTPIYPWPQIINITTSDGKEKYEIKYPGDNNLKEITQAYRFDIWPEVEFVEEFIKGYVQRESPPENPTPINNETLDIFRTTYNSIEFPVDNNVYGNKEQTKFFYEIYERIILNTYYSRLSRCNTNTGQAILVTDAVGESETDNVKKSLGTDNPYLLLPLKTFNINSANILELLKHFSNDGEGESWYNFEYGVFNTRYIKNLIENAQFQILDINLFNSSKTRPQVSLSKENNITEFIKSSTSNVLDVTDTFPFTDLNWCRQNLEDGDVFTNAKDTLDTSEVLVFNKSFKVISNFESINETNKNKPFTYFLSENQSEPNVSEETIIDFYNKRETQYESQLYTEGGVFYGDKYSGIVSNVQTTSILNTPYFVNAIQDGVSRFFSGSPYPYVAAAYLFLNSLPLATLKEKMKSLENGETESKSYIYATLKKFGAIHKLPYAWILKYGSIWHRYKSYIEGGSTPDSDILTSVWKNFDEKNNYDPISGSTSRVYNLTIDGRPTSIVLQSGLTITSGSVVTDQFTIMNLGFYPKTINDFSVFYIGTDVIKTESQIIGVGGIVGNILTVSQINGLLASGDEILGDYIIPGTTVLGLAPGTGVTNQYIVQPSQQAIVSDFYVTNRNNIGYTDSDVQDAFLSGLTMELDTITFYGKESDPNNPLRSFEIIPWNLYLKTSNNKFAYPLPSVGTSVRQYISECFDNNDILKFEITGNTSIFNGSIRNYWIAPNYGYFNSNILIKPSPFEYMKTSLFENFSINGEEFKYEKIDELLSVFNKEILDKFEQEFLNFSRSIYDYQDELTNSGIPESVKNFRNFQALIRACMKTPLNLESNNILTSQDFEKEQFSVLTKTLNDFLNYNVVVKIGNPSNFDRRLFFTFSRFNQIVPYTWREYSIYTPSALPTLGGGTTLAASQSFYPLPWRALYLYVGFSTIPELVYKDDGSYITDFFIDYNMEFSVENIKIFAPIIKIYATQKLTQVTTPPILPILPNDGEEVLRATYTLSNDYVINIFQISNEKFGTLVFDNTTLLSLPKEPLTTLNQTIVDKIILQIFPTQPPLIPPTIVSSVEDIPQQFSPTPNPINSSGKKALEEKISEFIDQNENYLDRVVDVTFTKLKNGLKNVPTITPQDQRFSELQGPQSKDELWETFKAMNDKWIAGEDISNKTLFEDVLLLDRASRNIGDKFLIDIFSLKNRLANIPERSTMLLFVQSILTENHFQVQYVPGYINFYNVQEAVKNPVPKPEGTLEIGNTLFGVHTNVDYTNSSTKMVCVYAGKPSEHLAVKNVDYRFRNDSFELTRVSDNPLIENQIGKTDWDKSNKVVGFNVDIGPQNQSIIKSFSVAQNGGLATMESLRLINQMANQAGNRPNSSQSVSLYNLYKNRSYTCNVSMLGNAMIQPTMYFNLRYVPMFTGPYLITEVNHTIGLGDFSTEISGVRQPTAALPTVDNLLQSLRQNLVSKIIERKKLKSQGKQIDANGNIIDAKDQVINTVSGELSSPTGQTCTPTVDKYKNFVRTTPSIYKKSFSQVKAEILNQTRARGINDDKLNFIIFAGMYLGSGTEKEFQAYEHNYSGVFLDNDWYAVGNASFGRRLQYFCTTLKTGNQIPTAVFPDLQSHIVLLIELWKNKVITYDNTPESYAKFLILNRSVFKEKDISIYNSMTNADKEFIINLVKISNNNFNAA